MSLLYKLLIAAFLLGILGGELKSQSEMGSFFLEGTWAARELNVTDSLVHKIEIYLPGIFFESHHNNRISFADIIRKSGDRTILNLAEVINQLEDNNSFENNFKVNTIGVGIKLSSFDIDFRHNSRFNSVIEYPKELAKLIFEGNSQYIGESVSFGPSLNYYKYHEYSIGVSKTFGDLALGGRIKYLSGIGFVQTQQNTASLFTDEDIYQLSINTDYAFTSSGLVDIDGVADITVDTGLRKQFFSKNNGVAFDFGAAYQVNDALKISASILDLGSIKWKEKTNKYVSNGDYTYEGFEIDEFLLSDSVEFEIKLDTLEEIFAFKKSPSEFKTSLSAQLYLAGQYQFNDKLRLGAILYISDIEVSDLFYGINAQYSFSKSFLLGINYGFKRNSFSNLGLQFTTLLGPVVIFGNTDNIISVFSNERYNLNGRIGLGLSF